MSIDETAAPNSPIPVGTLYLPLPICHIDLKIESLVREISFLITQLKKVR